MEHRHARPGRGLDRKRRIVGIGLILAATLAAWILHAGGAVSPLERLSHDQRMQWLRGDASAPPEIVLIMVDESSLTAMNPVVGRWPWPRELWAEMLAFLSMAEPAAVGFDILFSEDEGDNGPTEGELAFAGEAMHMGNVVQAMQLLEPGATRSDTVRPLPPDVADRFAVSLDGNLPGLNYSRHNLPVEPLLESARGLGVVTAAPDPDGIYRHLRPIHTYDGHALPGLSLATLQSGGALPERFRVEGAEITWRDGALPVNSDGLALVNPYAEFEAFSAAGIFRSLQQLRRGEEADPPIHPDELKDKFVFIGASAVGLHDVKATSLSSRAPGVYLHAALAGNLLDHDTLTPAPGAALHGIILVFGGVAGVGILLAGTLWARVAVPLSLVVVWTAWVFQQQIQALVLWPWVPVVVAVLLSWLTGLVYLGVTEGRDRRRVRRLLGQYVSPAVLNEVADQSDEVATGEVGTSEEMTVLFSDVRGFTSLSEQFEAAKVVELLNVLLAAMTDEIFAHQGTLDKFIGDAIMAFWGAPIRVDNHAERAVLAAVGMDRRMREVNREVADLGGPELKIGIGLHTGEVILGNIGSEKKLDYTIIGDNVNVASRMEGLTKPYGCAILFSGETRAALSDGFVCGHVDRLRVKGRQQPLDIYRPLSVPGDSDETRKRARRWARASEEAFRRYEARDWEGALEAIAGLPDTDPVRRHMSERYHHYQAEPPPPDWDGAYTMESK